MNTKPTYTTLWGPVYEDDGKRDSLVERFRQFIGVPLRMTSFIIPPDLAKDLGITPGVYAR